MRTRVVGVVEQGEMRLDHHDLAAVGIQWP